MIEHFNYEEFLGYLKVELEDSDKRELNDLELLIDYYNDFPPSDFDDEDSTFFKEEIERLAQQQLPDIKKSLAEKEKDWLIIEGGKFKLGKGDEKQGNTLIDQLESNEKALIDTYFRDLGSHERIALTNLYEQKISKLGTDEERLDVLDKICNSYKYSSQTDDEYIRVLEKAGHLACSMNQQSCYEYFEKLAKIYRSNYEHDSSADKFNEAIKAATQTNEANDVLLRLTRSMRIQYELAGNEDKAAKAFIEESRLTRINNGQSSKGVLHFISDYCQNPEKVAWWALGLILFSSLIYACFGLVPSATSAEQSFFTGTNNCLRIIWDSTYFSVVTFTTLGYGDFSPSDGISRVMAKIEALGGLFFTSLFLVTLVRKYGR